MLGLGPNGTLTLAPELSHLTALDTLRFFGCWLRQLPAALAGMTVGGVGPAVPAGLASRHLHVPAAACALAVREPRGSPCLGSRIGLPLPIRLQALRRLVVAALAGRRQAGCRHRFRAAGLRAGEG